MNTYIVHNIKIQSSLITLSLRLKDSYSFLFMKISVVSLVGFCSNCLMVWHTVSDNL